MLRLSILGASGSIGRQALQVVDQLPTRIQVVAMTAGNDWRFLATAALRYRPLLVAVAEESCYVPLREALAGSGIAVTAGAEGLVAAATLAEADMVLAAISGLAGLPPLLAAIAAEKAIALANKESLVAAGSLVMPQIRARGLTLNPVDSEHAALWQCLRGECRQEAARLILTASGGAFRDKSAAELAQATPEQALRHPNWRMGAKITIDCATMVNKGLEVIEAHWLFDMPYAQIDVLVHPESIVHSLVVFRDGSVKAQLGLPDMRLPIQYALLGGERPAGGVAAPDLAAVGALHFRQPDDLRFPALHLFRRAGETGGDAPAYLNGANEVLVAAFLQEKIAFPVIAEALGELSALHRAAPVVTAEDVFAADAAGRQAAREFIGGKHFDCNRSDPGILSIDPEP